MFRELLEREFRPYGSLSDQQVTSLERHYRLLEQWNARMNLTRIGSVEDSVRFHYCESLFLACRLPEGELAIGDVGSGPGFPGVPISIVRPECSVTLIESHQRKAVFLREASRDLPNVSVLAARGRDVGDRFDWVVSRAVDPAEVLALHLAPRSALLISGEDASSLGPVAVDSVPWGDDRVIATFLR